MGVAAIQHCRSYALEAERKMGEMLAAKPPAVRGKAGTGRGKKGSPSTGRAFSDDTPTNADLGISKNASSAAQALAAIPRETFDKIRVGEKTRTQAERERKETHREAKRQSNREKISSVQTPKNITASFSTILIDPPWDWGDEGDNDQLGRAKADYATMSIAEITRLPLPKLADTDCHLYMWITNRSLPKGFALFETWGFRYITALTWPKTHFGMGNYFRGQTEHVLFGVKGSQSLKRKDAGTLLPTWKRGPNGHSSKPVEFHEFIESCSPGPYLEMFSRSKRADWTQWGEDA
jgi:N6-adenosine-specific RNA methylase IME4